MENIFYKITVTNLNVGENRKSDSDISHKRIKEFNDKKEFLELFYDSTYSKAKTLIGVFNDIIKGNSNNIDPDYNLDIPILSKLKEKTSFDFAYDAYLILDYYLMKEREKIDKESISLPDRFFSSFFFKTKNDCLKY